MGKIIIARQEDLLLDQETLHDMFRFRYQVFYQTLGWEVETHNAMERDRYDDLNPVYMISKDQKNKVDGCWRLLPTTGAYMLKDTFPQLLAGTQAPQCDQVWELSRFAAVSTARQDLAQAGLGSVTFGMIRLAVEFAKKEGIRSYVTVTSVALERLFKSAGVPLQRLGRPQRIGTVLTVACSIEVDDTLCGLFDRLPKDKPFPPNHRGHTKPLIRPPSVNRQKDAQTTLTRFFN